MTSLLGLTLKEIAHRKLNFGLALLSAAAAVAFLVGSLVLLRRHDLRTEAIIGQKEAETKRLVADNEEAYRKITKRMGFNVLILPKDQDLADLYAENYASKFMPEHYVTKLASSKIVTVQHLLPSLQQRIEWPETKRTILLVGVRDEVPLLHRDPKKPILLPVEPGHIVVGHELHRSLGLKVGDKTKLMGREFTVSKCHAQRGSKDDITVWINLAEAQEMLDKKGLINGILALECSCAWADIAKIRKEIAGILPETRVIEMASIALARAETRHRAAQMAKDSLEAEKRHRADMRSEQEALAALWAPIVVVASALWIGLLMFINVRDRRSEIGILRALGLRSGDVFLVFIAKAVLVGLLGALVGYAGGWLAGTAWGLTSDEAVSSAALFDPVLLVAVLALSPLVAMLASWAPALLAAGQDPAVALREE